jgi:hypothetical protein
MTLRGWTLMLGNKVEMIYSDLSLRELAELRRALRQFCHSKASYAEESLRCNHLRVPT